MPASAIQKLRLTLDMIKFEHSVFALPFALTGALLAWRTRGFPMEGMGWKVLLVEDGNHRISVARSSGQEYIAANVIAIDTTF